VLDDLALPLGRIRIPPSRGTGGHNGLVSILIQSGDEEITRRRVGLCAAPREGGVDYVLGRFFEVEQPLVKSAIERGVEASKCAVDNGVVSAMNTFNKIQEP
jgi:PTH1 family peptidyl-tRNA hydrolase